MGLERLDGTRHYRRHAVRCWWCDVEAIEVFETYVMESAEPVSRVARWPDGDHTHAERAPTAEELAAEAYKFLTDQSR